MADRTMTCHAHRCCRKPAGTEGVPAAPDYVLLGSDDAALSQGAATFLRGAGAAAEPHDLGLRVNCCRSAGTANDWKSALSGLADALSIPARRALRIALVPLSADARAFQRALLMSQSLDGFVTSLARSRTVPAASAIDTHAFGDVFKGQSLE